MANTLGKRTLKKSRTIKQPRFAVHFDNGPMKTPLVVWRSRLRVYLYVEDEIENCPPALSFPTCLAGLQLWTATNDVRCRGAKLRSVLSMRHEGKSARASNGGPGSIGSHNFVEHHDCCRAP